VGALGLILVWFGSVAALAIILPLWLSFLLVGVGSIAVATVIAQAARRALRKASHDFSLVSGQLKEDLGWLDTPWR
jgi:membrane protein implicated in regulation of membrane protease activity